MKQRRSKDGGSCDEDGTSVSGSGQSWVRAGPELGQTQLRLSSDSHSKHETCVKREDQDEGPRQEEEAIAAHK